MNFRKVCNGSGKEVSNYSLDYSLYLQANSIRSEVKLTLSKLIGIYCLPQDDLKMRAQAQVVHFKRSCETLSPLMPSI